MAQLTAPTVARYEAQRGFGIQQRKTPLDYRLFSEEGLQIGGVCASVEEVLDAAQALGLLTEIAPEDNVVNLPE